MFFVERVLVTILSRKLSENAKMPLVYLFSKSEKAVHGLVRLCSTRGLSAQKTGLQCELLRCRNRSFLRNTFLSYVMATPNSEKLEWEQRTCKLKNKFQFLLLFNTHYFLSLKQIDITVCTVGQVSEQLNLKDLKAIQYTAHPFQVSKIGKSTSFWSFPTNYAEKYISQFSRNRFHDQTSPNGTFKISIACFDGNQRLAYYVSMMFR